MSALLRPLAPFARGETYRALLFYIGGVVLGGVGLAVLIAGWCLTAVFCITPLVVPLLIGLRGAVGFLARAEAGLARLVGVRTNPPARATGIGFWSRGAAVLRDSAFWNQQAYIFISGPIALIQLCLLSWAIELIALPFYYGWLGSFDSLPVVFFQELFGVSDIDTLGEALLFVVPGIVLLLLAVHLMKPLTRLSRRLAARLLASRATPFVKSPAELRAARLRALRVLSATATSIALALIVIWALTTGGYFWPVWPLLSLGLAVGIPACAILVAEHPTPSRLAGGSMALAAQIGISVLLLLFLVGVWAASGGGYFWPAWPTIGLAVLAVVHVAVAYGRREHRIERLETSRAGAVDAQEAELRRIERDLHDGAQARLVALGMNLGMAEQKLETDPEAVRELLAEARRGAGEALEELRDLARGIHPPILTDRGLEAALAALTVRSPLPVSVSVDVPERLPAAVEKAAYFVVAEALANVSKHAEASRMQVQISSADGVLVAEVVDDGRGGADPSGNGLTGLRRRVEALDGSLRVTSPAGGPTIVRAELPCGS